MLKKIIVLICAFSVLIVCFIRIGYVNETAPHQAVEEYECGQMVPLDNTFIYSDIEQPDGYSVRVDGYTIKTYEEYILGTGNSLDYYRTMENSDLTGIDNTPEHVLVLTITIRNRDNTNGFIFLSQYGIQYENDIVYPNAILWAASQKKLGDKLSFKLRKNTEMTFQVPYAGVPRIEEKMGEYLRDQPASLVVSIWPVKRMISIS